MKCLVTGAAGFIGSNLIDRLLNLGYTVIGYDNFSTGNLLFLSKAFTDEKFSLIKGDILDKKTLSSISKGCDIVFHLAARADIRNNANESDLIYKNNVEGTYNVLDTCIKNNIPKIMFPSTGSVYGDSKLFPSPENSPMSNQTSIYAASKISAENMIQAYCNTYDLQGFIFRFVSVLGQRYTHGHIIDFYNQLKEHPHYLKVLGTGNQRKSYIHVNDLIAGIIIGIEAKSKINIFNIATDETSTVKDNIKWILEELNLKPKIEYGGGLSWIGDNELISLNCNRLQSLGWQARNSIQKAVRDTVKYLKENNDE